MVTIVLKKCFIKWFESQIKESVGISGKINTAVVNVNMIYYGTK